MLRDRLTQDNLIVSSETIQIQYYKIIFDFQNICEKTVENSWLSGAGVREPYGTISGLSFL